MQVIRVLIASALLASATPAYAEDAAVSAQTDKPEDLDIRLTLSSFLYRQAGDDAPPLVDNSPPIENASPVRRYFGDLRIELADSGLAFDGRVRQTTSERYQSGAGGGAEYEIRTLAYKLGTARTQLTAGRQYIEAIGSTKLDGASLVQRLAKTWSGTIFAGAMPALGSRSLDTDYPGIEQEDGTTGAPLVPLAGGFGASYQTPDIHGDVGLAAVYVAQDVPGATSSETSRVFAAASGYARPARWLDIYHFALLDVAGNAGANLTNGSLGVTLHPSARLQVSASANHVSVDLLQVAAKNLLEDPDPNAIGVVQNNISIIRVSQDTVRGGASLALAESRFEVSVNGGYHRRPAVDVALADGGTLAFPSARTADATVTVLDRKSIAGLRLAASGSATFPLGNATPNSSRSTSVRVVASRPFRDGRAELATDVMVARFRSTIDPMACADSLDVFACFSSSRTWAAQAGALGSYQLSREWLFLLDAHLGMQDLESRSLMGTTEFPRVLSLSMFGRAQWRFR